MTVHGPAAALLRSWLPANDVPDRPQVQLATVDEAGQPHQRTVLLSEWDLDGFAFHTDSTSRKAQQLRARPAASMLVLWPGFTRQLVIGGRAEPADEASLQRAFARRSPYLRQLAWQNSTALAQAGRDERVAEWRRFLEEHEGQELALPPTWTGFVLRPDRLTFWQSDPEGPSHRVEHRLEPDGSWSEHHLAG